MAYGAVDTRPSRGMWFRFNNTRSVALFAGAKQNLCGYTRCGRKEMLSRSANWP